MNAETHVVVDRSWRVRAAHRMVIPLRRRLVWGQMRDFERFVTRDPLHTAVIGFTRTARSGAPMVIRHRVLGLGPDRRARVLRWREGSGYAFSDLSQRGNDVGFPHVCTYDLEPIDDRSCTLTIGAHGRWTATWIPRVVVHAWLRWVLVSTAGHVRRELNAYRRYLVRRGTTSIS